MLTCLPGCSVFVQTRYSVLGFDGLQTASAAQARVWSLTMLAGVALLSAALGVTGYLVGRRLYRRWRDECGSPAPLQPDMPAGRLPMASRLTGRQSKRCSCAGQRDSFSRKKSQPPIRDWLEIDGAISNVGYGYLYQEGFGRTILKGTSNFSSSYYSTFYIYSGTVEVDGSLSIPYGQIYTEYATLAGTSTVTASLYDYGGMQVAPGDGLGPGHADAGQFGVFLGQQQRPERSPQRHNGRPVRSTGRCGYGHSHRHDP